MVSKCLNSNCSATFQYLGQGRLFCVDFAEVDRKRLLAGKPLAIPIRNKVSTVEYFWLCDKCAADMTVSLTDTGEVRLIPLQASQTTRANVA
jgi:hypothetical protein